MIADAVSLLACPVCHSPLSLDDRTLRCARGHSFDLSRHGHVSLLARPRTGPGDSADMVEARSAFLATGHYEPLTEALAEASGTGRRIVDIGGGTGHHLARLLDRHPSGVGIVLDSSVPALRRAARAHPRIAAVGADIWQGLPLRSGSTDTLLGVFAPRNGPEMHRVLDADGSLIVVTPQQGHLAELPTALRPVSVDPDKDRRLAAELGELFTCRDVHLLSWTMRLDAQEVRWLVSMSPNARHVAPATVDSATRDISTLDVTASVRIGRWTPLR